MVFKHVAYQDEGIPNVYVAGSIDNYSNFKNRMSLMSTGITISLTTSYKGGQSIEQVYNIEDKSTTIRTTYLSSVRKNLYDELPQVFELEGDERVRVQKRVCAINKRDKNGNYIQRYCLELYKEYVYQDTVFVPAGEAYSHMMSLKESIKQFKGDSKHKTKPRRKFTQHERDFSLPF